MKILNLGLDTSILDNNSPLARRIIEYGNLTEKYTVILPAPKSSEIKLSDRVNVYGVNGINKSLKLLHLWSLAKKILRQDKYDIITIQDAYFVGLIGLLLSKKFQIGSEIQIHGWEKFSGLRKTIAKFVLQRANAIRVVSQRLKKQLIQDFRIREEKITVAPIYIELGNINYEPIKKNKDDKFIFLTVGRLVPIKNIAMQIETMAEVSKKYSQAELWILGAGPEEEKLKFKIKNLKLTDKVKIWGYQNNLEKFYTTADVFLLTSYTEGWPLSIMEAAGYALAIIMTDVGSAGELIINEKNGLVIPINDQKALEIAMARLIEDEGLRKSLGERARQALSEMPSKEQILQLYQKSWKIALLNK